jgi:hypothetical protein
MKIVDKYYFSLWIYRVAFRSRILDFLNQVRRTEKKLILDLKLCSFSLSRETKEVSIIARSKSAHINMDILIQVIYVDTCHTNNINGANFHIRKLILSTDRVHRIYFLLV